MTYNPDELAYAKAQHPSVRRDVSRGTRTDVRCERCGHDLADHTVEETASNHLGNLYLGPGALRVCCAEGCVCYEIRTRSWDVT